jgi:hypothetical protein
MGVGPFGLNCAFQGLIFHDKPELWPLHYETKTMTH